MRILKPKERAVIDGKGETKKLIAKLDLKLLVYFVILLLATGWPAWGGTPPPMPQLLERLGEPMKLIDISSPKYPNAFAMVDDADFDWLNQWKWCLNAQLYVIKSAEIKNKKIRMHRLILNPPIGMFCDHIDGNKRNNQRNNLRICSISENGMNSKKRSNSESKFKGCRYNKINKNYNAEIKAKNKRIFLGCFKTEIDAALAYNEAAKKHFGEFARINII